MKTVTVTGYDYHELPEKVRERLAGNYVDELGSESWWYEFLEEELVVQATECGFSIGNIRFSGFWSQGDGASFDGTVYPIEWLKSRGLTKKYWKLYMNMLRGGVHVDVWLSFSSSNYCHSNTMVVGWELWPNFILADDLRVDELEILTEKLANEILDDAKDMARQHYNTLRKKWEALTSEDAIAAELGQRELVYDKRGHVLDTD